MIHSQFRPILRIDVCSAFESIRKAADDGFSTERIEMEILLLTILLLVVLGVMNFFALVLMDVGEEMDGTDHSLTR